MSVVGSGQEPLVRCQSTTPLIAPKRPHLADRTAVFVLVAILASATVLTLPLHDARAQAQGPSYVLNGSEDALEQSTLGCSGVGGSWSNTTFICTVTGQGSVPSGASLEIDSDAGLVISQGATFNNSGTIENNGDITNSGTIDNGGSLTNTGTLTSYGDITNSGNIANSTSGIVINSGTMDNDPGGDVTNARDVYNSGAIKNSGAFTDSCLGEVYESGTFSGSPVVSCGTTSTFSQSSSTTTTTHSTNLAAIFGVFVLAILAIALVLRRGGVGKAPVQATRTS